MLLPSTILAFALLAAPASEQERMNAARVAFESDDFTTAVRGFESLAHEFPAVAKYRYYAGLARENAGQDTHAYFHMQMFLASGAGTDEEKKLAAERAAAIARRTTRVRLQLSVADHPGMLHVTYRGPKSQATRPEIIAPLSALPQVDTRTEIALEPGTWVLSVDPAVIGDEQIEPTTVEMVAGESTKAIRLKTSMAAQLPVSFNLDRKLSSRRKITIELRREGSDAPPIALTTSDVNLHTTLPVGTWTYKASGRGFKTIDGKFALTRPVHKTLNFHSNIDDDARRRRRMGLGLAGVSVLTAIPGAALLPIANGMLVSTNAGTNYGMSLAGTGMGLLGATTGLWVTSLSSISESRQLWISELVLGVLIAGAGGAWLMSTHSHTPLHYPDNAQSARPKSISQLNPQFFASTYTLGLGTALIGGAAIGTAMAKSVRHPRSQASFLFNPHPTNLTMSFRFAF